MTFGNSKVQAAVLETLARSSVVPSLVATKTSSLISKVLAPAIFAVMQDAKGPVRAASNELLKRLSREMGRSFWELEIPDTQRAKLRELLR